MYWIIGAIVLTAVMFGTLFISLFILIGGKDKRPIDFIDGELNRRNQIKHKQAKIWLKNRGDL